jgi:ABC-type Na+ efflux pump permease subunit
VLTRLFWQDVKQSFTPLRVLLFLALTTYLAFDELGGTYEQQYAFPPGILTRHRNWLQLVIPIVAGLMGASLARERREGITLTLLAHGVSRWQYLRSKLLGAAASGALFTTASIALFYAMSFVRSLEDEPLNGGIYGPPLRYPLPLENLVVHDVFCALMLITATAAWSLVGVLAGLIIANEYVAMASAPIVAILAAVLLRDFADAFNPEEYFSLYFFRYIPTNLGFVAPFLYWGGISFVIAMLSKRILAKKEFV